MKHEEFLKIYAQKNSLYKTARLFSIINNAAARGIISKNLIDAFYECYLPEYVFTAEVVTPEFVKKLFIEENLSEERLDEICKEATYLYLKFEKEILKAEKKVERRINFYYYKKMIFLALAAIIFIFGVFFPLSDNSSVPIELSVIIAFLSPVIAVVFAFAAME